MKACGLIVEYNPLHNGHLYHIEQAKKEIKADCTVAIMSGSFLQRGEPAIIDKYYRTQIALQSGIDIVLELPYAFAVQSSQLFAKGSVQTLNELGVDSICFGSESGDIYDFINMYTKRNENKTDYTSHLKHYLNKGYSFPHANKQATQNIGIDSELIDLTAPNNILGFSYVQTILDNDLPITPVTIKRIKSNYHDKEIKSSIASATSIRKQLGQGSNIHIPEINQTMPTETINQLLNYKNKTGIWHEWELYFKLVYYRVLTMSAQELSLIHGVDEGIENRIIETIKEASSFNDWVKAIKTKRYTWTRIQRIFTHILTNTTKTELDYWHKLDSVPYIRLLGATKIGRNYLKERKKEIAVPLITSLNKNQHPLLSIEERATNAYYSILPSNVRNELHKQELKGPIII